MNITKHHDIYIFDFIMEGCIDGTIVLFGIIGDIIAFLRLPKSNLGKVTLFTLKTLSTLDASYLVLHFMSLVWPQIWYIFGKGNIVNDAALYTMAYVYPLGIMASTGSTWMTVMICYHRYISVCKPLDACTMITISKVRVQTFAIIVYGIVITSPRLLERNFHVSDCGILEIGFSDYWYNSFYQGIYKIAIMLILNRIIPLLYMCIASVLIIHTIRKQNQKVCPTTEITSEYAIVQQQKKITITLMMVVTL